MNNLEKNLSEGNVVKQLLVFSFPFLISNLIQSLYNVADMLIVGNFSGTNSLSGVTIGGQVTFILTNIIAGLCTGGTILVAQYLGAKDREAVKESIATLITTLLIAAVGITIVMLILKEPVLKLLQTPAESYQESNRYLLVTVLGIVFIFGYNALSAIMRGMGDSKRPFYFVLIACITNIILDFVLVAGFHMAAFGAAIATVISQALSMILCIIYLIKNKFLFDFKIKSFRLYKDRMVKLIKVGLPSAIQNGIVGVSFLFLTALVNVIGGVNASAAVGVVAKINGFAILPAVAMSSSISAMCAQNIGANRWDRAEKTFKVGTLIAIGISLVIFAVVMIFPEPILKIFDRDNQAMIDCGITYIRTYSFDYIFVPIMFGLNGLFVGAGHTTFSLINSILSSVGLRIPACILFGVVLKMGLSGVGLGAPVASFGAMLLALWYYFSNKWRKSTVIDTRYEE